MSKPSVFYSFHYELDVIRTQQIRNIGALDNSKPVLANDWERIKRQGDKSISNWIDKEISKADCLIVLIGHRTFSRRWVRYEIKKAWEKNIGLMGIYIHNLKDFKGITAKGTNPFETIYLNINGCKKKLSDILQFPYDPGFAHPNKNIIDNLETLVKKAIHHRKVISNLYNQFPIS